MLANTRMPEVGADKKNKLGSEHLNYNATSNFRFMFEDYKFTDVTLVCEDH